MTDQTTTTADQTVTRATMPVQGSNKALAALIAAPVATLLVELTNLLLAKYGLGPLPTADVSEMQGLITGLLVYFTPHGGA